MRARFEALLIIDDATPESIRHIVSKIEQYMRELKELDSFYSRCEIEED